MTPADFQQALDAFGVQAGERTQRQFANNYLTHWRDEEATTNQLLGALVAVADIMSDEWLSDNSETLTIRATSTQKHREAEHGVDALIRFRCEDPLWRLDTAVLLQAKRQEPGRPFGGSDHERLRSQLIKMLSYTTEAFVMVYSAKEGVCLVPAVAAYGLQSRDLFDLAFIRWPRFLSGVLRGRFGELRHHRVPDEGPPWTPMFELEIVAQMTRNAPLIAQATA